MPTDNNNIITTTVCVGQSIAFTQCCNFVAIMDQLAGLLKERSLVCLNFTFQTLWSLEHCIPSDLIQSLTMVCCDMHAPCCHI